MKTKDNETQCPNKNRLLGLNFRHLRRIDTLFAEKRRFGTTVCQSNSICFFAGFSVHNIAHLRGMSRPGFGCSAGFQPAPEPPRWRVGKPELDRLSMEGQHKGKNAPEEGVSRFLGPPRDKSVMRRWVYPAERAQGKPFAARRGVLVESAPR